MKPFNWNEVARVFLVSRPEPCPYLPDRQEQKLITLIHPGDEEGFQALSNRGFRRSHDAAYHPICAACKACQALRVRVQDFRANKTQRRLIRRYSHLHVSLEPPLVDHDHWQLFTNYVQQRHAHGAMAHMTRQDFASMVADTPVQTRLISWRDGGEEGRLVAACLADLLPTGISAVYSYYSLNPAWPSLGTYVILALIDLARRADMAHVHLGYWVQGSQTMDYKARFSPAEVCVDGVWQALPTLPKP